MSKPMVAILGAGRPFAGSEPPALTRTSGQRRTLDWIIESITNVLEDPEIHFVGGYRMDEILERYPDIHFSKNEDWDETGVLGSLLSAPLTPDRELYVSYSDIIFQADVVDDLRHTSGDITLAVDSQWRTRYSDRTKQSLKRAEKVLFDGDSITEIGTDLRIEDTDAEFTGLVRFSPECVERILKLADANAIDKTDNLPTLLRMLSLDFEIGFIDIQGNWAELETADDLARFVLDTKANTLRRLEPVLNHGVIKDRYIFTINDWEGDEDAVINTIRSTFNGMVIIRSSALAEDTWNESNAGRFESILDVPVDDPASLTAAIQQVIDSYPDSDPDNQVLVQPMLTGVDQSGVVMTRSIKTGSPYYVINYDAATGSTESVTDGSGEAIQTAIVRKGYLNDSNNIDHLITEHTQAPKDLALENILAAVREIENVIGHNSLDIEFAVTNDRTVHIFQVRPIPFDPTEETIDDRIVSRTVEEARQQFLNAQSPSPFVLGERTIYGVMPDWNPAEIIGRNPRQLAHSLYRYLIMDETWARQRAEYGYRDVRPQPLLKGFAGQPYVDVRAVFTSFIPASVPDELAKRLVEHYLDRLESNPELHDKIEFEIAITCLTFDFETQTESLRKAGFTAEELEILREGVEEITIGAFNRLNTDYEQVDRLVDRFDMISKIDLPPLRKARLLLEDCRRFGTLPFAHLARSAFVAVSLLRSLERKEILGSDDVSRFLNSLNTVAHEFERDGYRVANDELEWKSFVDRYGHLRPGTYEITSPNYASDPNSFLEPIVKAADEPDDCSDPTEVWNDEIKRTIEHELTEIGLAPDFDQFITFLRSAIEGREYAKFVFTRNLSEAMEQLAEFGEEHEVTREQLSHVPIRELLSLTDDHPPEKVEEWLAERARKGKRRHRVAQAVELPPLLFNQADFNVFERPSREANFVTDATITAEVCEIEDVDIESSSLNGRIIMIPQADPGYDWLFGYDIAGLITMYGGMNSHMAVRAAEFSLPAAIGVGENQYERFQAAEMIELDCSGRTIRDV